MHFISITRVFSVLLSIQLLQFVSFNIFNIFKNLLNLIARKDFVKSFAIMFLIKIYLNSIISFFIIFFIQWYLTSMCFIHRWCFEFLINVIIFWLSVKSLIKTLMKYACNWINNKQNQIAFLFAFAEVIYSASQNNWMTRSCRFKFYEMKSSNKK